MRQLDLFQWDSMAVGKGYQSLAQLDFADARSHFSRVLEVCPAHPEAGQGLEALKFWEEACRDTNELAPEAASVFLWERISAFPFVDSDNHRLLRQSLLRRLFSLLSLVEEAGRWYLPPDLCLGYLCLQLGEYAAAERHLRVLLDYLPDNGILRRYLGDALWRQGREDFARAAYAMALLLAPNEVDAQTIPVPRLNAIIQEYGAPLAPVYGFFAKILPLVEMPTPLAGMEARAYEWLRQAEEARRFGRHQPMVEARRELKGVAPGILADYLQWLARAEA